VGGKVVIDTRGDGSPMFKRLMPYARGMAYMIRRRRRIAVGLGPGELAAAAGNCRPNDKRPNERIAG
jgi:large subunit ribosomal protein L22